MSPEEQKGSKNLIQSMLYHAKTEGVKMDFSDKVFVHEIMAFLIAGSDTTTYTFTMMIFNTF